MRQRTDASLRLRHSDRAADTAAMLFWALLASGQKCAPSSALRLGYSSAALRAAAYLGFAWFLTATMRACLVSSVSCPVSRETSRERR
jgi:hypothetical protein